MSDEDYDRKLDELDRLLNDPDVSMQPARVWSLLAELSLRDCGPEALGASQGLGAPTFQGVGD
jgi:hypothetical protein